MGQAWTKYRKKLLLNIIINRFFNSCPINLFSRVPNLPGTRRSVSGDLFRWLVNCAKGVATFHCGEIRPRPVHCSLIQTSRSCHGQWVDICTLLMCFSRAWHDRETWKIHRNVSKLLKKLLNNSSQNITWLLVRGIPSPLYIVFVSTWLQ